MSIEEKMQEFVDLWNDDAHYERYIAWLRTALLEVHTSAEQAGYARAMGEAKKYIQGVSVIFVHQQEIYPQLKGEHRLISTEAIEALFSPTDNNKV